MAKIIYLFFISFLCINNALAESTPWTNSAGGRARILLESSRDVNSNERRGTIEIDLKPLWKTYWSNPGTSGMAPTLTINNNSPVKILFPVPEQILANDEFTFGFHGHILLPFKFVLPDDDAANGNLRGSATIGICKNLCIPMQIPFEFKLNQSGEDFRSDALIDLAFSRLPTSPTKTFYIKTISIDEDSLAVTLIHPIGQSAPKLFLDGGETEIGPATIISRTPTMAQFVAPILELKQGQKKIEINYIAASDALSITGVLSARPNKQTP